MITPSLFAYRYYKENVLINVIKAIERNDANWKINTIYNLLIYFYNTKELTYKTSTTSLTWANSSWGY